MPSNHITHSETESPKSKRLPSISAMAQEFLNQLLRIENTVQKDELEIKACMVCLERYGALDSSTGAVELPVRLPCNHLIGTICIARWLRDSNSCPACRATFFPAQPRPYLEHGIMDDNDEFRNRLISAVVSEGTRRREDRTSAEQLQSFFEHRDMNELMSTRIERMGGWDEPSPLDFCEWFYWELHLELPVVVMARSITAPLSQRLQGEAHSPQCIAAISVYIAWHLSNQGDNDSSFLANLSRTWVSRDHIRSTWASIYENRMELISQDVLPTLARSHMERILDFLPVPIFDGGIVVGEDNDRDSQVADQRDHPMVNSEGTFDQEADYFAELDHWFHEALRDEDLLEAVKNVCALLTVKMLYQADVEDWSAVLDYYSDEVCQATCVFMACHFMGVAISYHDAARVHNTSERSLRQLYAYVLPRCSGFIDPNITDFMGIRDLERVLSVLPALNWPPP